MGGRGRYLYIYIGISREERHQLSEICIVLYYGLLKKLSNEYSLLQTLMLNVTPNQVQVLKYTLHMNNLNQTIISLKISKIREC